MKSSRGGVTPRPRRTHWPSDAAVSAGPQVRVGVWGACSFPGSSARHLRTRPAAPAPAHTDSVLSFRLSPPSLDGCKGPSYVTLTAFRSAAPIPLKMQVLSLLVNSSCFVQEKPNVLNTACLPGMHGQPVHSGPRAHYPLPPLSPSHPPSQTLSLLPTCLACSPCRSPSLRQTLLKLSPEIRIRPRELRSSFYATFTTLPSMTSKSTFLSLVL